MKTTRLLALMGGLALCFAVSSASEAEAGVYRPWGYHRSYGYHYSTYYYQPTVYHYAIYYPRYPRYVYYYNPIKKAYWGRFDLQGEPGQQYSLLPEEHRKEKLSDIPESAFPAPAALPPVPDNPDGPPIDPPPAPPQVPQPGQ